MYTGNLYIRPTLTKKTYSTYFILLWMSLTTGGAVQSTAARSVACRCILILFYDVTQKRVALQLRSLLLHWIAVHSITTMHDMTYRNIPCVFMYIHLYINTLIDMLNDSTSHVEAMTLHIASLCLLCGGGRIFTRLCLTGANYAVRITHSQLWSLHSEGLCHELSWLRSPLQWLRVLEQGQLGPQNSQCSCEHVDTSCRIRSCIVLIIPKELFLEAQRLPTWQKLQLHCNLQ